MCVNVYKYIYIYDYIYMRVLTIIDLNLNMCLIPERRSPRKMRGERVCVSNLCSLCRYFSL